MADFLYGMSDTLHSVVDEDKSLNRVKSAVTRNQFSSKVLNILGCFQTNQISMKNFNMTPQKNWLKLEKRLFPIICHFPHLQSGKMLVKGNNWGKDYFSIIYSIVLNIIIQRREAMAQKRVLWSLMTVNKLSNVCLCFGFKWNSVIPLTIKTTATR